MEEETNRKITALSLNCWGLWMVSKYRQARMQQLAAYLLQDHVEVDLIGLQEIWLRQDYMQLCDQLQTKYPYAYYFRSGVIGSGLAVLSRFPIIEVSCHRFSVNGKPQRFLHGDYLGGKAVGLCRIRHPAGPVDFYNTHLHARYADDPAKDEYAAHRIGQAWEVVRFIRHTARHRVIVVGDLNVDPRSLAYRLLTTPMSRFGGAGLVDCWDETVHNEEKAMKMKRSLRYDLGFDAVGAVTDGDMADAHPSLNRQSASLSKEQLYQDGILGFTCGAATNSFTPPPNKAAPPERIDYVFYLRTSHFQCDYARVALMQRIPQLNCSYSDHYGVLAVFHLMPVDKEDTVFEIPAAHQMSILQKSPTTPTSDVTFFVDDDQMDQRNDGLLPYLDVPAEELLVTVIRLLTWGIRDARHRGQWSANIRFLLMLLTLGFLITGITVAFVPWTQMHELVVRLVWFFSLFLSNISVSLLLYYFIMTWFVIPEELSALERIRSEIVLWVSGHRPLLPSDMGTQTVSQTFDIPMGADVYLDYKIVEVILRIAGIQSTKQGTDLAQQHTQGYASVPSMQTSPIELQEQATRYQRRLGRFARGSGHVRRISNMADPGPSSLSQDVVAFNALSSALRFGSVDHPLTVVDTVEGVIKDLATQTQRTMESFGPGRLRSQTVATPASSLPSEAQVLRNAMQQEQSEERDADTASIQSQKGRSRSFSIQ